MEWRESLEISINVFARLVYGFGNVVESWKLTRSISNLNKMTCLLISTSRKELHQPAVRMAGIAFRLLASGIPTSTSICLNDRETEVEKLLGQNTSTN